MTVVDMPSGEGTLVTTFSLRCRLVASAAILVVMGAVVFSGRPLLGQQDPPSAVVIPESNPHQYVGTINCENCHDGTNTYVVGGASDRGDWISANEFAVWRNEDIHSQAYQRLKDSPLTEKIGRLMQIEPLQDVRCLACHFPHEMAQRNANVPGTMPTGVVCESCHGPAKDWMQSHIELTWREMTPEQKSQFGMFDLRDPLAQANVCLSCHVGQTSPDPLMNRIVTHEMYAAGHPPLPGVEVASFAQALPPHWRYSDEKFASFDKWLAQYTAGDIDKSLDPETIRTEVRHWPSYIKPGEKSQTRLAVLGNVLALKKSMDWIIADTEQPKEWPHLECYDCYACHHELRTFDKSIRQKRGAIGGRPGRPMLKRWPNVLIELAVEDAKYRKVPGGPELLSAIDQLDRTFAEVPFGNPADVRPAAEQVDEACQTLLNGLKEKQYTTDDARRLFVDLCRLASADNAYLDYDSARQVAWALEVFWHDFASDSANDVAIGESFEELDVLLDLEIPARQFDAEGVPTKLGINHEKLAQFEADLANDHQQFRDILRSMASEANQRMANVR